MTKQDCMMERIRRHGEQLLAIFPEARERDPVKLCKELRRLEAKGAAIALRLCNGPEYKSEEDVDEQCEHVLDSVHGLLHNWDVPIFLNRDPRGYALKIQDYYVRAHNLAIHQDWGGYGILAPDLTEEG